MAIIAPDIGIDMGTSNTLIYVRNRGIVINEPTVMVVRADDRHDVRAIGADASALQGRLNNENIVINPFSEGTAADYKLTRLMMRYFIRKAIGASHLVKPRAIVAVPCCSNPLERTSMRSSLECAGARKTGITLVDKPFAAAIGCGLPAFEPHGSMVVDIGGGTTEAAVIALGGIVVSRSIRMGGTRMDEAIVAAIKRDNGVVISQQDAERLKLDLGAALPDIDERRRTVYANDMVTRLMQPTEITSTKIYEALREPCQAILAAIKFALEHTPPELAGDILHTGIHLTGGGANLPGLDQFIATALGIPVLLAKDPGDRAALGVGYLTENIEQLDRMVNNSFLRE